MLVDDRELTEFVRAAIALRRSRSAFAREGFFAGAAERAPMRGAMRVRDEGGE